MGVYYAIVCDERREKISPYRIGGFEWGVKALSISSPGHPFSRLVIHAMTCGRWAGLLCRIVSDAGEDDSPYFAYTDVTLAVEKEYERDHGPLAEWLTPHPQPSRS